jgi:folate-binding protein YgfZ
MQPERPATPNAQTGHPNGIEPERDYGDWLAEYHALRAAAGVIALGHWTQIELAGRDAAAFLNRLASNKIAGLPAGGGCETFLLNAKGHVLAHLGVYIGAETLVLQTVPGESERLLAHLDFYLITEQVRVVDRTSEQFAFLLAGPEAAFVLRRVAGDCFPVDALTTPWRHWNIEVPGSRVSVHWSDPIAGGGLVISCSREAAPRLWDALLSAGARPCGQRALEAARIEAGWPWYGRDITDENLAQEVGRDAQAISFNKGCYLGQEPVARIASRGHVNRKLAGVRFDGKVVPDVGAPLTVDGQPVGHVTSASISPALGSPLALAYVRREHTEPGSRLDSAVGPGEVVTLPIV